jgi:hypothetical protein
MVASMIYRFTMPAPTAKPKPKPLDAEAEALDNALRLIKGGKR